MQFLASEEEEIMREYSNREFDVSESVKFHFFPLQFSEELIFSI